MLRFLKYHTYIRKDSYRGSKEFLKNGEMRNGDNQFPLLLYFLKNILWTHPQFPHYTSRPCSPYTLQRVVPKISFASYRILSKHHRFVCRLSQALYRTLYHTLPCTLPLKEIPLYVLTEAPMYSLNQWQPKET